MRLRVRTAIEYERSLAYLVSEPQLFLAELHASSKTLCHAEAFVIKLACELKTDSAKPRPTCSVDTDAGSQLADDSPKVTCFEAAAGSKCAWNGLALTVHVIEDVNILSVHGITYPCDRVLRVLNGFNVAREVIPDLDSLVKGCRKQSRMNALFPLRIW